MQESKRYYIWQEERDVYQGEIYSLSGAMFYQSLYSHRQWVAVEESNVITGELL